MTNTVLLGATLAAVFTVSMLSSAIATGDGLGFVSGDGFTMTVDGAPGQTTDGHDILVYAFFTDREGKKTDDSFIAYVAAFHPTFTDDGEQHPNAAATHAHRVELDNTTLCVKDIKQGPVVKLGEESVTIKGGHGNVVAHVIAGYNADADGAFGGHGICPITAYAVVPVP